MRKKLIDLQKWFILDKHILKNNYFLKNYLDYDYNTIRIFFID